MMAALVCDDVGKVKPHHPRRPIMMKENITNLERFAEEVGSESVWV